jgi:hypothetical protein
MINDGISPFILLTADDYPSNQQISLNNLELISNTGIGIFVSSGTNADTANSLTISSATFSENTGKEGTFITVDDESFDIFIQDCSIYDNHLDLRGKKQ